MDVVNPCVLAAAGCCVNVDVVDPCVLADVGCCINVEVTNPCVLADWDCVNVEVDIELTPAGEFVSTSCP